MADVCRRHGISPGQFYGWEMRARGGALEALQRRVRKDGRMAEFEAVGRELWRGSQVWQIKAHEKVYRDVRWLLRTNLERLSEGQHRSLATVNNLNEPLFRAYLIKEGLRQVFRRRGEAGLRHLDDWLTWARRCQIDQMAVAARVSKHRAAIEATLLHGLSNARVEAFTARFQLINRRAYGFHSAGAAISLAFLCLGGLCPSLPGQR